MIRAVVDVNVVVSAVIGPFGHSRRILLSWEQGFFSSVTSEGIVTEVEVKLRLPRITRRYRITEDDARWVFGLLLTQAQPLIVPLRERRVVTGDPEDDYVLATARLASADYLVTGDAGLLALGEHEGTQIVSPRAFLEILPRQP